MPRTAAAPAARPRHPGAYGGGAFGLADSDVAGTAALVGDPGRAAMLLAVLDGRALPAGELARAARVAPSTASAHLERLVAGGLLAAERHGRHRYFRLADPAVARALEALALAARPGAARSGPDAHAGRQLHFARTCYDHLAGWLGVRVAEALVARGALTHDERGFLPGPEAPGVFGSLGVDVAAVVERTRRARRPLARVCLDWSERRPHVAGALGAALVDGLLAQGWVARQPAGRALRVTEDGRRAFRDRLGVRVSDALVSDALDPRTRNRPAHLVSPGTEAFGG